MARGPPTTSTKASRVRAICFSASRAARRAPKRRSCGACSVTSGARAASCARAVADPPRPASLAASPLSALSKKSTSFFELSRDLRSSASKAGANLARKASTRGVGKGNLNGRESSVDRAAASSDATSSSLRNSRNNSPSAPKKNFKASRAESSCASPATTGAGSADARIIGPATSPLAVIADVATCLTFANFSSACSKSIMRSTSKRFDLP
mmetsp:Transcript_10640/g.35282  ORF Transcript_10640/g.35282 Transcript_10640/m.35282 type:complete len:212 (-) Transcript_10640:1719-2354(-)